MGLFDMFKKNTKKGEIAAADQKDANANLSLKNIKVPTAAEKKANTKPTAAKPTAKAPAKASGRTS